MNQGNPFRFAYSSNIFIVSLDLMVSMLVLGTLKYSRIFLSSSSFRDHVPVMKLICSTIHPESCIVLLNVDRKDWTLFVFLTTCDTVLLIWPLLRVGWWRRTYAWIPSNRSPPLWFSWAFWVQWRPVSCSKVDPVESVQVEPLPFFVLLPPGLEDVSSLFLLPCSKVFVPCSDQRPLEILDPILSTLYETIFLH